MDKLLYDRGLARRRHVLGDSYVDRALSKANDFNREFQRLVSEYCWGEVWGEETLSPRERSILTLGMVAALGKMGEFANHVRGASAQRSDAEGIARGAHPNRHLLRDSGRRRLLSGGRRHSEQSEPRARPFGDQTA